MDYHIISDSCADIVEKSENSMGIAVAPLSIMVDNTLFLDDSALDINDFKVKMKSAKKLSSGAPSPGSYLEKLQHNGVNFIVTLSSKLSSSYSSAMTAKKLAEEENINVHVFDSLNASAGQMLVIRKLYKLIQAKLEKEEIIMEINKFIKGVQTYFTTQDLSNLIKNGRLGKVKGKLLSVLGIRPILRSNGEGDLIMETHARGDKQTLNTLIEMIARAKRRTYDELVITHFNNSELAQSLKEKAKLVFDFKEIIVAQTRGLSSLYANDKGLVMAF